MSGGKPPPLHSICIIVCLRYYHYYCYQSCEKVRMRMKMMMNCYYLCFEKTMMMAKTCYYCLNYVTEHCNCCSKKKNCLCLYYCV